MQSRILTNRNFPDGKSKEWITVDEQGRFFWRADDYSFPFSPVSCGFPVDLQFVKEKFIECGRIYENSPR
jgi:hypothetical protein